MRVPNFSDVNFYNLPNPEQGVVLSDIDDTLRKGLILKELCPVLNHKGEANIDLDEFNNHIDAYLGGDKDSARLSLETCMRGLRGVSVRKAKALTRNYLNITRSKNMSFAVPVLKSLASVADIYLVSAEPQFVTDAFVEQLKSNKVLLTGASSVRFGADDEYFTGDISDISFPSKGKLALKMKDMYQGPMAAFGDHPNDLPMLEVAEQPVVVAGPDNSQLQELAIARNWSVIH